MYVYWRLNWRFTFTSSRLSIRASLQVDVFYKQEYVLNFRSLQVKKFPLPAGGPYFLWISGWLIFLIKH